MRDEEQAEHHHRDPDAANDVGALPPKQKQLAEQERPHNMTATFQETIGCRGRVGADALGQSRLTDVTDDGRFLINVDADSNAPPITLMLNWKP